MDYRPVEAGGLWIIGLPRLADYGLWAAHPARIIGLWIMHRHIIQMEHGLWSSIILVWGAVTLAMGTASS